MFYLVDLFREIDIPPRMFGPQLEQHIKEKVKKEAEETVDANVGYIITVKDVDIIGKGRIRTDGSGFATFSVKYQCICMRVWRDEIIDAEVTAVHKLGISCRAGPIDIMVSEHHIPDDFSFRTLQHQNLWTSEENAEVIEIREQSQVRLRIINVNVNGGHRMQAIGTMNGDYLGVINI